MKVELLHLTRVFQRGFKAVDDLSFSFTSGEVVGFVGPNGAGKTTTMRMLATLDVPDSGDILIDGKSILDDPSLAHRAVGFMPDDLPNRSDTTVDEYLDFFGRAYGLRGKELADAINGVEDLQSRQMLWPNTPFLYRIWPKRPEFGVYNTILGPYSPIGAHSMGVRRANRSGAACVRSVTRRLQGSPLPGHRHRCIFHHSP